MATALGIDIGKHSIRAALLRTSARKVEAERYLELPIARLSSEGADDKRALSVLAELLASLPSAPDSTVIAIDGARVSLRQVKIPVAAKKRALEVLPFELEQVLPFPLDEVLLDYQEIGVSEGQVNLLCATVLESVVVALLESFTAHNVTVHELAAGAPALDGLLTHYKFPTSEATILVHLGEDSTDVCIVRDGTTHAARTLDEGTNAFESRSQALHNALHQTIVKYRADGGIKPTRAVVMGVGSDNPEIVSWIGSVLDVAAEPIMLPAVGETASAVSPVFGKAFALAARTIRRDKRIDMRLGKYALPRGVNQLRQYALLAVTCVLCLFASYTFRVWAEYRVLASERDALAEELEQATEQHFRAGTRSPKRAKELLENSGVPDDPLPKFDAFKALAAISGAVPGDVTHDTRKLEIQLDEIGQGGKFEIQGMLPDLGARDRIVELLDGHDCIGEIEPGKIQAVPGQDRKSYTLNGAIACPGTIREGKGKGKDKAKRSARSE